jgi:hypothetical protein
MGSPPEEGLAINEFLPAESLAKVENVTQRQDVQLGEGETPRAQ